MNENTTSNPPDIKESVVPSSGELFGKFLRKAPSKIIAYLLACATFGYSIGKGEDAILMLVFGFLTFGVFGIFKVLFFLRKHLSALFTKDAGSASFFVSVGACCLPIAVLICAGFFWEQGKPLYILVLAVAFLALMGLAFWFEAWSGEQLSELYKENNLTLSESDARKFANIKDLFEFTFILSAILYFSIFCYLGKKYGNPQIKPAVAESNPTPSSSGK